MIHGDRVRSARLLRRLKSADVAIALGWPASRQSRLEQSEDVRLEQEQLAVLSRVLGFPEMYFQAEPPSPILPADLLFRAAAATTKKEKAYLAEFARTSGEFLEWLDKHHRLPPVRVPSFAAGVSIGTAATEVRRCLGVSLEDPIDNLIHRTERAGIPVVMRGTPGHLSLHRDEYCAGDTLVNERHLGYSTRAGDHRDRPLTVIRAIPSWERVRWTVAHELGHIALHSGHLPRSAEQQASEFANELLAPVAIIEAELPSHVTLASLTPIKLKWGVSLGALIIHLGRNNLISTARFETLRRQLYTRTNSSTGRTWGRDEPGWDAREVERPRLLSTWLERCLGSTAPQAISNASGIWPADIVGSMLSGQRPRQTNARRPHTDREPGVFGREVVDLDEWRTRPA
jgi:transcriptional regulator with XRE-family HTH domain